MTDRDSFFDSNVEREDRLMDEQACTCRKGGWQPDCPVHGRNRPDVKPSPPNPGPKEEK